ncbi:helix-turn-helix domain-containing protein [Dysgonomonas capnocytophagoides]|uniref:helix-turn-helix domain-containing protein n=1 Tax=Dysgonomonas capnocytophagoides TaxID=45254 RepID=UPI0039930082
MKAGNKDIFTYNKTDFSIEIFRLEELTNTVFSNYQRYDFHQIIWFVKTKGDNLYSIDFNKYTISDNQIVIIYPRQIERVDLKGKEGFLFAVNNDVFFEINQKINSDYLNGYFSNVFISLDKRRTVTLNHIQSLIIEEYNDQNRSVLMESYLQSFLFHIASFNENKILSNNRNVVLFVEFVKLTDNNFIRNRDVVFYAKELNISEKKLNEVCKALSGKTTKQFIQERLILEIKKEIKLGTKNLKEIAFELGFNESAYLTRFFKQQTSISPSEFKEEK